MTLIQQDTFAMPALPPANPNSEELGHRWFSYMSQLSALIDTAAEERDSIAMQIVTVRHSHQQSIVGKLSEGGMINIAELVHSPVEEAEDTANALLYARARLLERRIERLGRAREDAQAMLAWAADYIRGQRNG